MKSFRLNRLGNPSPVTCPSCGESRAVRGRLLGRMDAGGGLVFRPDGLRALACMGTDVTVDREFFACTDCGHIWSSLPPKKLRGVLDDKGGKLLRSRMGAESI